MKNIFLIIVIIVLSVLVMTKDPKQIENADTPPIDETLKTEITKKADKIRLFSPVPNDNIKSPLVIKGEARGTWFFEASFPIYLTDWDGLIIAEGYATAEKEWMTTDFVPFSATLTFKNPEYKNNGSLILKKDNPSGLPQNDDALEIPIFFAQ